MIKGLRKVRKNYKKALSMFIVICIILGTEFTLGIKKVKAVTSYLLSLNRPCYASSVNGGDTATRATDGDINTAWGAAWNVDNQWIDIDLGAVATVDRVVLKWQSQNTYATKYQIQVSNDETTWKTIYTQDNGTGGTRVPDVNGNLYCVEDLSLSGTGRYVRMYAPKCVTGYGVALYEFEAYGTGGINQPPKSSVNLAKNKNVTVSSYLQPWWSKDSSGNVVTPLTGAQAVDGNQASYWLSDTTGDPNSQWIQVDLGQAYTIGEVDITWDAEFGRVYDLQISNDGQNWTTIYRQLHGTGEAERIPLYATGRYVKLKGIAMGRGSGYSIHEFQVLQYVEGDPKTTYTIPSLPTPDTVTVGKGSYSVNDVTMAQPRYPKYVTSNINTPIPSNDWWTSVIYTRLSDGMPALPLMYHYYDTGLGFYYASDLFTAPNDGGMDTKFNNMDLFINSSNIVKTPEARLDGYGDYSANIIFSDDSTAKMKSTLIKGSPYVYNTFSDPNSVEVSSPSIVGLFDDNNNAILANDGDSITGDHVGIEVTNTNTAPESKKITHDYGIFAPAGSTFTRVGSKIKIKLGSGQNYMSVGLLTKRADLNYVYQHAYAFVTNTTASYNYDMASAKVNTTYTDTIDLKRTGFSSNPLMTLFPTQWKYTTSQFAPITYNSARGLMKVFEGNSFMTSLNFNGITPSFGEPTESGSYSRAQMLTYLNTFKASVTKDYWVADPYWQGKKLHPLAMGILIAEELGEYDTRDQFISILRKILTNWFTYSGADDNPYYMYYSSDWGTLVGQGGDHGMGINLSDHHFLWGYFTFAAGVLAAYDKDFVTNYGGMVEQLLRDAQNPSRTDNLYPYMRNFDPYEGHSWAGGYGDNQSGNNQESSSEATFAWAGEYLWGLATGNNTFRDAGIWGFTSEVNAIEQYWFNYDKDNWASDYDPGVVGMVWGSAYTYGTYFSGNPSCIYGIHWLPVSPVLTYLGYNPTVAARIYSAYRKDEDAYQAKLAAEGKPNADPEGWFHITWPYEALSDPQGAINKWDDSKLPDDERFNSYWFVQNMSAKGNRVTDIWSSNWTSYQVFKKGTKYSAVIWNPTNTTQFVQFRNAAGNTGSAYVLPRTTLTVDPFVNNGTPTKTSPVPKADPSPIALPGTVEAENYYTNFSCTSDVASEGGACLAYIDAGDSALYDVDVAKEGDYSVSYRVNNGGTTTGKIQLKSSLSGSTVLSSTDVPNNNGTWTTVSSTVHLKAGVQRLTLYFATGGFNLNWFGIGTGEVKPTENIALNKTATASSYIGGNTPSLAFDGDSANTRWESNYSDPQWITVDLGSSYNVTGAKFVWETAAAKDYKIQVSTDNTNWVDAYTKTGGTGGTETLTFTTPKAGRYVRMYGTSRTTGYGYSLWGFEVYGTQTTSADTNLALNKTATASSYLGGNTPALAVDNDSANTRWESNYSDPQWIAVDLGANYTISGAKLVWETAAGKDYKIQVSTDNTNWVDAYTKTGGTGGTETLTFTTPRTGRYVRMYGTARTTGYGYSLWDFQVYGR
ncbi:discoidin domain-containing protein [Clostridium sp. 'White wine YQ']|uniref:discoidin domain-containing protein n=1 Tax=Clostridium sp. 'White wine YQ' TaxID=3027474 RepID=UPI0023653E38|nr:discoidin domain-containing protein [Clostridium sp. 'White wine YQ']MDD7793351.1 discoidin domain-containing protein [Clostridium sp. 'White wine YQ']